MLVAVVLAALLSLSSSTRLLLEGTPHDDDGSDAFAAADAYLGCVDDPPSGQPVFLDMLVIRDTMSVDACRELAALMGLPYFGLKAGRRCYGGRDVTQATANGPSTGCDIPCPGDSMVTCGGPSSLDVYLTKQYGDGPAPPPPDVPDVKLQLAGLSYDNPPPFDYGDPTPNAPPLPPGSVLLPPHLEPEVAYFDAAVGVSLVEDAYLVSSWQDVNTEARPGNVLHFSGECFPASGHRYLSHFAGADADLRDPAQSASRVVGSAADRGSSLAIAFDGKTCYGLMYNDLPPAWSTSPESEFTMVWIGRFRFRPVKYVQAFLTLGRTPDDYDKEIYWETDRLFVYSHADGFAIDFPYISPVPENAWTLEVFVRRERATSGSYYRYGSTGPELQAFTFASRPCSVGPDALSVGKDYRDNNAHLYGQMSVLLIYNRSLTEAELLELSAFYAPRFGWQQPGPQSPPPPRNPPNPLYPPPLYHDYFNDYYM